MGKPHFSKKSQEQRFINFRIIHIRYNRKKCFQIFNGIYIHKYLRVGTYEISGVTRDLICPNPEVLLNVHTVRNLETFFSVVANMNYSEN